MPRAGIGVEFLCGEGVVRIESQPVGGQAVQVGQVPGPVPTGGALDPITVTGTQTDSVFIIAGFVEDIMNRFA